MVLNVPLPKLRLFNLQLRLFYLEMPFGHDLNNRYPLYDGLWALFPYMDPAPFALFSHLSVRTGKEKYAADFNSIYTNHFIAQAVTSVRTEVVSVPTNAAPTKAVPISSVGPVPPAVAADSPAAAESPAQEDGDQTLLKISPLTTVTKLEYQRLATI